MIVRRKVNQLLVDGEAICRVDQNGNLTLDSLCNDIVCVVELSPEELKAAYQEQQKIELTATARNKLAKRFHIDESSNPEGQSTQYKAFLTIFGRAFVDTVDPTSEEYLLPQLVEIYLKTARATLSEDETWRVAIDELVFTISGGEACPDPNALPL